MKPGSPEWAKLITASKVAAILGVSPWESQRSVWHKMRGDVPWGESNEQQRRGHYLEPAILAWWRDQHGMREVSIPYEDAYHEQWTDHPEYQLGDWAAATPDAVALIGTDGKADWQRVLVEAKSAAIMDDWGEPGTDVIPAYYLVQVYWQLHLARLARCYVPVIGPRLAFSEYVVDYDAETGADLERRMRAFYDSLTGDPPDLDDTLATYDVIRKVHPDIDAGVRVELTEAEAAEYVEAGRTAKEAVPRERLAKATVLDRMGRAQYAVCNGERIARRQPGKGGVSLYPVAKNTDFINPTDTGEAA